MLREHLLVVLCLAVSSVLLLSLSTALSDLLAFLFVSEQEIVELDVVLVLLFLRSFFQMLSVSSYRLIVIVEPVISAVSSRSPFFFLLLHGK